MTTRTLARWIEFVSWGFVALGLALPFAFHASAFEIYRNAVTTWAYGSASVPAADRELLGLLLGITGGSIAGKWIVHALLARGPLAEGRAWARDLTLGGLASWFVVDSAASLAIGATFNVWMINLVPLALVGLPLVLQYRNFGSEGGNRGQVQVSGNLYLSPVSAPISRGSRGCFWVSVFGVTTGLAIAFGAETPLFSPWFAALEHAHYGGAALADATRRLASFFFGPIGGCTVAQFAMLAGFVRCEGGTRRVAVAGAASILAWFAIDSAYGVAHGGLFNIAMINVPALLVTLPPWLVLAARLRGRDD